MGARGQQILPPIGTSDRPRRSTWRRTGHAVRPEPLGPLRQATPDDLPTLIDHRLKMWEEIRSFPKKEMKRHARDYRRFLLRTMAAGDLVAFIAPTINGSPAASGAVWFTEDHPRPAHPSQTGYILSMYTSPPFRGRGLARRIVRAALRECRRREIRRVSLHASPFGRRLYRKMGFERSWEMRLVLPAPRRPSARGA